MFHLMVAWSKWSIVRKIHGNTKSDFCKLCLTEKYFTLNDLGDANYIYVKTIWIRSFLVFDILVFYIQ